MPISLIRNTKDNAMHGTDNGKYTGCRMKLAGGSWYTREGELKDITDLTCERCKEVFATKMIRESNKEELRIAKEEKKRYQKAKKQGIVREATYEEYLMNREAEESAKKASRNDEATSRSLQMLRDAIPGENPQPGQPVFTSYGGSQSAPAPAVSAPQAPFDPYSQSAPAQSFTAPQNMFDPYAQQAPAQSVTAPQNMFDPYAQSAPAASAPQNMFDPYAQTPAASVPSSMFDPYAQSGQPAPAVTAPQNMFDPYAQSAPAAQKPVVSAPQAPFDPYAYAQPQNTFDSFAQNNVTPASSAQLDEISSVSPQETKTEEPTPVFQEYTGAASVSSPVQSTAQSAPSASDDDFLSQFLVKPQPVPETVSAPSASEPVTAQNIVSATDDILSQFSIGSQLAEQSIQKSEAAPSPAPVSSAAKADASSFFSDNIPVIGAEYAGASSVNSAVTEFGSLNIAEPSNDEFVVPNVPVYQPSGNNYVSQNVNNYSKAQTSIAMDELASPGIPSSFTQSTAAADYSQTESIMNGFDSVQTPSAEAMSGFGNAAPSQPAMNGFGTAPSQPAMNGFGTAPSQPAMNGFGTAPSQPAVNSFGASQQNPYAQPQFTQPQNPYAQPQSSGFQMPQGYGASAQARPAAPAPAPKPAQKPSVFAPHSGTADSIEEALRQLGADVGNTQNANNQMPEKEELVPDFVAYVPSSSKVLHQSAPSQSASSNVPKRPISAREAKQLAKIDAKFKKDLISRGFNPNEIKNGRRGK
jgi:hypothetical protein